MEMTRKYKKEKTFAPTAGVLALIGPAAMTSGAMNNGCLPNTTLTEIQRHA